MMKKNHSEFPSI